MTTTKNAAYYESKIGPKLGSLSIEDPNRGRIGQLLEATGKIEPPEIEEGGPEPKPDPDYVQTIIASIEVSNLPDDVDDEGNSLRSLVEELIAYAESLITPE